MSVVPTIKCFPPASKCHNCERKNRDFISKSKSGALEKRYSRCSGCLLLTYCKKDCQTEHWYKVHRQHCKYLSGKKLLEQSEHNKDSCTLCIENHKDKKADPTEADKEESFQEFININSPKMPCYIESLVRNMKTGIGEVFGFHDPKDEKACKCSLKFPCRLPFTLGEVSGKYLGTGHEEMMAHAQKLATAMMFKSTNRETREKMKKLDQDLHNCRVFLMYEIITTGDVHVAQGRRFFEVKAPKLSYFNPDNAWYQAMRFSIEMVKLMNQSFNIARIPQNSPDDPKFSELKYGYNFFLSQVQNFIFTSDNNLWSRFKFWPKLSEKGLILCAPEGVYCQTCDEGITGEVCWNASNRSVPYLMPNAGVSPTGGLKALCSFINNTRCELSIWTSDQSNLDNIEVMNDAFIAKWNDYVSLNRFCDFCLKASPFCHRCEDCLASQYCSDPLNANKRTSTFIALFAQNGLKTKRKDYPPPCNRRKT